jgi:hypothetical protein
MQKNKLELRQKSAICLLHNNSGDVVEALSSSINVPWITSRPLQKRRLNLKRAAAQATEYNDFTQRVRELTESLVPALEAISSKHPPSNNNVDTPPMPSFQSFARGMLPPPLLCLSHPPKYCYTVVSEITNATTTSAPEKEDMDCCEALQTRIGVWQSLNPLSTHVRKA